MNSPAVTFPTPCKGRPLSSRSQKQFSRGLLTLFTLFVTYTAFPVAQIPLINLSLSAPIFLLIVLEIYSGNDDSWLVRYKQWLALAVIFWLAILLSAVDNGFLKDNAPFDLDDAKQLVRYAYWLLTFLVAMYLVAESPIGPRLVKILSLAVLATAIVRWGEAVIFGKIGAWIGVSFLTQNTYGILFSTYSPYLLVALAQRSRGRDMAAALIVWGAVAINGSRSSWIAVTAGICLFALLYLRAFPAQFKRIVILILTLGCFVGLLALAPGLVQEKMQERFDTFQKLDQDKSYGIRLLMMQKGWKLFWDNPLSGVGPGRFKEISADLDLPKLMRYGSQRHFNIKSAHNSYVALLAETGLAGALPYLFLFLVLLIEGYRAAISMARRGELWALGIYVSFVTMSIHLWALAGLSNTGTWVVYGMVAGIIVIHRRRLNQVRLSSPAKPNRG